MFSDRYQKHAQENVKLALTDDGTCVYLPSTMLSKDSTTTVDALKAQHHPSPGQIIAFFWGGPKSTQKCSADGGNSLSLSVGPGEVYLVSDRDGDTIKILVTKEKDPRIGMNGCVASISAVWAHLIGLDKIVVWKNISYLKTGIFDSVVGFYKSCGAEAKSVQTIDLNAGVQLDFSVGKGSVKLGTAAEYRLDETLALNKEHQYKRITIVSDESGRITYDSIISCPNYTPDQMKRRSVFQIESRSQPPVALEISDSRPDVTGMSAELRQYININRAERQVQFTCPQEFEALKEILLSSNWPPDRQIITFVIADMTPHTRNTPIGGSTSCKSAAAAK